MIAIRVHRVLGATFADLFRWGALTVGLRYFLGEAAPKAGLSQAYTGAQGSGKTTFVRAVGLAHDEDTRMLTIETDFELGLASLGRPWTQEMQARIPVVGDASSSTDVAYHVVALAPSQAELGAIGSSAQPLQVRIPAESRGQAGAQGSGQVVVQQAPTAAPAEPGGGSVAEEWWFWTLIAALVIGGVTVGVVIGTSQGGPEPGTLGSVQLMQVEF